MKVFLKRLCAFAVVAVMALSLVVVGAASEETSGCALTNGELGLLEKLEIITDTTDFERGFTRGELAVATAKLMNLPGNTSYAKSPFADVAADGEYYPYICALAAVGVFSGDGNGRFRPDDIVQFTEICKVLTVPLGYKNIGEMKSYIDAARMAGISDGVDQSANVTVGTAYEMLYKALHAPMFEPYSFGEMVEYRVNPNQTALKQFHGLVKMEGIVDGVYGTKLTSPSDSIEKDEITVGGKTYKYSSGKELLGYSVDFYLSAGDESLRPQIKHIFTDDGKNNTLVVDADDIYSKKNTEFVYYNENDKAVKVEVSPRICVIYNGIANSSITDAQYIPDAGEVTFIDNNGDRKYDVVKITSYEYAVIKNVNAEERIIYAKYPDGKVIGKVDGREVEIEFKVDGFDAYFAALTPGTIIVSQTSNNPYGKIYSKIVVLENPISGKITSLKTDSIKIGDKSYTLAANCITDAAEKGALAVGQTVTAYKHDGRIVTILRGASDGFELGYLVDAGVTPDAFNPQTMFQVLCADRTFKIFEGADKLTIDGVKVAPENVLTTLATTNDVTREPQTEDPASNLFYTQLIKYKVNTKGEIYSIDTPYYNVGVEPITSLQLDYSIASRVYFGSSRSFNTKITDQEYQYDFYTGSDTISWMIPMHRREDASLYSTSNAFTGNETGYNVEAYNVDGKGKASIILRYQRSSVDVGGISNTSEHLTYIVSDIYDAVDEAGDAYKYLSLVGSGTATVKLGKNFESADVQVGDVIKYDTLSGELYRMHNMFGVDDYASKFGSTDSRVIESVKNGTGGTNIGRLRYSRLTFGTIMDIDDDMILHTTTVPKDGLDMTNRANLANFSNYVKAGLVYIYDKNSRSGKVELGTMDDIITHKINPSNPDKVIIGTSNGTVKYIYVLRGWE